MKPWSTSSSSKGTVKLRASGPCVAVSAIFMATNGMRSFLAFFTSGALESS